MLCAAALALAAWAASAFPDACTLERSSLASGQVWRLWTGHLVHASRAHFNYDVGAAVLLCCVFGPGKRWLWMPPVIGIAILAAMPGVEHYYGLSAVLHAWVVVIAAKLWREKTGAYSWIAAGILAVTIGKAALETALGHSLFTAELDFGGPVLHASHLIGALIGLLPGLLRHRKPL